MGMGLLGNSPFRLLGFNLSIKLTIRLQHIEKVKKKVENRLAVFLVPEPMFESSQAPLFNRRPLICRKEIQT